MFQKLRAYNADLQKQLETARRQLEEETVLRVDLENRLQSLREELAFNKQMHDQVNSKHFMPLTFN